MIPVFFISKILLDSFFLLCSVSNLYMPDVHKSDNKLHHLEFNTFYLSRYKVPFYDISHGIYYNCSYDPTPLEFIDDDDKNLTSMFSKLSEAKLFLEGSYFFKFLLDKNDKIAEYQYNFFEAKGVPLFSSTYKTITVTKFPSKSLYFLIILNVWFILFITNLREIVSLNLSLLGFVKYYNSDVLLFNNCITYKNTLLNIDFNVFNLFNTTYKNFDLFYMDN